MLEVFTRENWESMFAARVNSLCHLTRDVAKAGLPPYIQSLCNIIFHFDAEAGAFPISKKENKNLSWTKHQHFYQC
jgi:hypothetical protein